MSLFNKAKISLFWVFIESFFLKAFSLVVSLVLTRLLLPADFGLIGLITVFITTGKVLIEGGMGASLIRDDKATEIDFSSIFIGNLLLSLILYALLYFTAPAIATYFENEALKTLIRVYGITLVISAFSTVQSNVLMKSFNFKRLALLNMPGTVLGAILAIVAAFTGAGVWSLVIMALCSQFLQTATLWFKSGWRPTMRFNLVVLKKHFNFGYKLMLSSLLNTVFNEVYTIIIGKRFALETLGYYTQARTFNLHPVNFISAIVSKATYPLLSSIQQDKVKISTVYQTILRVLFFVVTPLMMLLAVIARPLFILLFSEKWEAAIPFFQILAFSSLLIPIHSFNINVFKVFNRTDLFLRLEIIKRILTVIVIAITWYFNIYGLIWGMVFLSYISLFINTYYSGDLIDYKTLDRLKDMIPIFLFSFFSASLAYLVLLYTNPLHEFFQIVITIPVYFSTYVSFCKIANNYSYQDFLKLSQSLLKAK